MEMECREPSPSTPDVFDIYSSTYVGTTTTTTLTSTTTTTTTTTTMTTQFMKLSGSITTAYSFTDDLNDPNSSLFKEYASTVESEMISIILKYSLMKLLNLKVIGFKEVSRRRKRRQEIEISKALAEFEAFAEVSGDVELEDLQDAVEDEIKSASDEGLQSLNAESFNTIRVIVITTTTATSTLTSTTTSTSTSTSTSTTISTTMATTLPITHDTFFDIHGFDSTTSTTTASTPSAPELSSLSTCPAGNDWFKIDQSNSMEWSWMASISIGRRASAGLFSCSGVILSPDWILTAADCCKGSIIGEMEVYTGSLEFSYGKMHKVKYYKTEHQVCALRLEDRIFIDGTTTSLGCFKEQALSQDGSNCWMAAWQHKVMTHDRQNGLISNSVQISNYGSTGTSVCDTNIGAIDFTGSPVMCQSSIGSYISSVVWEDKGCKLYTKEVLLYDSSLMHHWIANLIKNDEADTKLESSTASTNEILETVQSIFNFLGGVFNFLAEREKNS